MTPKRRFRAKTRENIIIVFAGLVGFGILVLGQHYGLGDKWKAAVPATCAPFAVVILSFRRWWSRPSFWMSFVLCLLVHSILLYYFLSEILSGVYKMGIYALAPIAFAETFVLFIAIVQLAHLITGKSDSIKLS